MVTTVEEAISRFRGAFELLLPFSYCAKEKKESVSLSYHNIFGSIVTPMVFTPTHVYTEKYIYVTSTEM